MPGRKYPCTRGWLLGGKEESSMWCNEALTHFADQTNNSQFIWPPGPSLHSSHIYTLTLFFLTMLLLSVYLAPMSIVSSFFISLPDNLFSLTSLFAYPHLILVLLSHSSFSSRLFHLSGIFVFVWDTCVPFSYFNTGCLCTAGTPLISLTGLLSPSTTSQAADPQIILQLALSWYTISSLFSLFLSLAFTVVSRTYFHRPLPCCGGKAHAAAGSKVALQQRGELQGFRQETEPSL